MVSAVAAPVVPEPPEAVQAVIRSQDPRSSVIPMTSWLKVQVELTEKRRKTYPPKTSIPVFDRALFGNWINADSPADCFNSRTEALLRDLEPKATVKFSASDRCRIESGKWWDPYSNKFLTQSNEVDIDHVVALKHAYYYGAFKWDKPRRCHYANYLGNNYHLLTVSAHENRSKGADDPRAYMPPNKDFVCNYLKIWMKIKMLWDLDVDKAEAEWIVANAKENRCRPNQFYMGKSELAQQLVHREEIPAPCARMAK